MDPFTELLQGPRARDAFVLRAQLDPPWGMRVEDEAALAVLFVGRGTAHVRFDTGESAALGAGDVALVRGPEHYVVGDSPTTEPQIRIDREQHCWSVPDGRSLGEEMSLGVRSWGHGVDAATTLLVGCYELRSHVTPMLLDVLPRVAVVGAASWTSPLPGLLLGQLDTDAPGQAIVLDRMLDLVLLEALRAWFAGADAAPRWWLALDDPVAGPAVRAIQHDPVRGWTVASLAALASVSRATFAKRFTEVVGQAPMSFLTDWRLLLAADRLDAGGATIASIAREVGYGSPFSLSAAFTRRYGLSPKAFRDRAAG